MKRFLLAVALLALAGCASAEVEAVDGIAATNARFEETFNAGDAAGLAGLYTAGAVVMAPNTGGSAGGARSRGCGRGSSMPA